LSCNYVLRAAALPLALSFLTTSPPFLGAQTSTVAVKNDHWRSWASIALGPGSASGGGPRVAGDIALWATYGSFAASLRSAGVSRVGEVGDMGDYAVLLGVHYPRAVRGDGVIALGVGQSSGRDSRGFTLPAEPVLAASVQLNLNYVLAGIGLDGFAGFARSRRYYGGGLALAVGWFQ
jgi:hypothetical protein